MNTNSYWCHLCKREFTMASSSSQLECSLCQSNCIEEISRDTQPQNYIPFSSESSQLSNRHSLSRVNLVLIPRNLRGISASFLLQTISNSVASNESGEFDSILDYIMNHDSSNYGNPPASKQYIIKNLKQYKISKAMLKKIPQDENSCPVCKEELKLRQNILKMPCKHLFHKQCLMPWLKERNSCPTCRFELPTDDKDYEDRKQRKSTQNVQ